jgi:cytochrome c1
MNIPSIIFFTVFVLPLVAFLVWVMRQDKRKGITGLIVLGVLVIGGILWMFWKTGGR